MSLSALGGRAAPASGQGAGDAGDMTVTLVSSASAGLPSASQTAGGLRPLLAKYDTGAPPVAPADASNSDLSKLLDRLSRAPSPATDPRLRDAGAAEAALDSRAAGPAGADHDPEAAAHGGGGLWGVIEPCWKSLAQRSAAPVTLEVSLDLSGAVSTPPQIIRPPGAPIDERQLQAEARALTALSNCMTQREPQFSGRVYRLSFRPPRR
jgi:hypothetical protein